MQSCFTCLAICYLNHHMHVFGMCDTAKPPAKQMPIQEEACSQIVQIALPCIGSCANKPALVRRFGKACSTAAEVGP